MAARQAAATASHHCIGSCSCMAPSRQLVRGRASDPTTSPSSVTAMALAAWVPRSRPSQNRSTAT
jgi:hypothetical protein